MLSGIILASGFSRRMQQNKLLLPLEGKPLVERVISAAAKSRLDESILVYRDEAILQIGINYGAQAIHNKHAAQGQSAAVRAGVTQASPATNGYLFLVGDQPYITAAIIDKIIEFNKIQPDMIIVSVYDERRGNPVLFPKSMRSDLLALTGDSGGRQIMAHMPER
ncbi:MAG: nucleotidyltransferase family protein, partial [Deltaproteobacteria bacterium]|nr:nucleotidyltransferase family protein [Deltaproteobacteria bacterium]